MVTLLIYFIGELTGLCSFIILIAEGMMRIKKVLTLILTFLFASSLLYSQSVVELAKKERERRAKLKGKKSVVITNADLKKANLQPAVSIPKINAEKKSNPPSQGVSSPSQASPQKPTDSSSPSASTENLDQKEFNDPRGSLEERLNKAREYVELLSLKLRALWQKFYSMDDMTPRGKIKKAISDTHLQLKKAQQEVQKLEQRVKENK